jgi:hypothetical protein
MTNLAKGCRKHPNVYKIPMVIKKIIDQFGVNHRNFYCVKFNKRPLFQIEREAFLSIIGYKD